MSLLVVFVILALMGVLVLGWRWGGKNRRLQVRCTVEAAPTGEAFGAHLAVESHEAPCLVVRCMNAGEGPITLTAIALCVSGKGTILQIVPRRIPNDAPCTEVTVEGQSTERLILWGEEVRERMSQYGVGEGQEGKIVAVDDAGRAYRGNRVRLRRAELRDVQVQFDLM